jgi:hypothetical protein
VAVDSSEKPTLSESFGKDPCRKNLDPVFGLSRLVFQTDQDFPPDVGMVLFQNPQALEMVRPNGTGPEIMTLALPKNHIFRSCFIQPRPCSVLPAGMNSQPIQPVNPIAVSQLKKREVDFPSSMFVLSWIVGQLDMPDTFQVGLQGLDQISLHDLHVVLLVLPLLLDSPFAFLHYFNALK